MLISAGIVDELELHIVPSIMGNGVRLFSAFGDARPRLEQIRRARGHAPGLAGLWTTDYAAAV